MSVSRARSKCEGLPVFSLLTAALLIVGLGVLLVAGSPPVLADGPSPASKPRYRIDMKGGRVVDALRFLGRTHDINIIIGEGVEGNLPSLRLREVTAEEALDGICQAAGLHWEKRDDAYVVSALPAPTIPDSPLISVKVALLSEGGVIARVLEHESGKEPWMRERIIHDPAAGVLTVINPHGWATQFFRVTGMVLDDLIPEPQVAALKVGEERTFGFVWPKDRPQYYLEEVEQDLYRRVELADKEGYTVSVCPTGEAPEYQVEVRLARNTLTGGKYDEAIRAFVGRPTLTSTVVTRTVPLTGDQPTLLLWQRPPQIDQSRYSLRRVLRMAKEEEGAPAWAVGEWEINVGEGMPTVVMRVLPDSTIAIKDPGGKEVPGTGAIDPSGRLEYKATEHELTSIMTGILRPDGAGSGTGHVEGLPAGEDDTYAWTATRKGGPAEVVKPPVTVGETAPGVAGVAVLLEVGAPQEAAEAQVPEEVMALLNEPGPEIEISCKFVEIERDPDKPLEIDWQANPQKQLRTLLNEGRAKIINEPRVKTENNKPTHLDFSTEIPYQYATITYDQFGKRSVDYETDTVTAERWVSVKPVIVEGGMILMDIEFRFDDQVSPVVGPEAEVIPIIATRQLSTTVRVHDGETAVIGGLVSRTTVADKQQTAPPEPPRTTEWVILVTPKILRDKAPAPRAESEPVAGEMRDGEQWVWDIIKLKYEDAAAIAQAFGGSVVSTAAATLPEIRKPAPKAGPPRRPIGYGGGYDGGGVMLPKGMDPPMAIMKHNVLLVHGTQEAIDQFRKILSYFDQPAKQIEIATKFVEVEATEGKAFGIDWFVDKGAASFSNLGFAPGVGLNVACFRRGRLEAELRALLDEGRAKIINEPRVITQNNQPAEVSFYTERPYTVPVTPGEDDEEGATTGGTRTVTLRQSLFVTPRVREDDTVVLDLQAEFDYLVGTETGPDGEVVPIVSTQTAYLQVRVPDGDTLVIGGLLSRRKVFDERETSAAELITPNTELLIFVTARILRDVPRR